MPAPANLWGRNFLILLVVAVLLIPACSAVPPGTETRISYSADTGCNNVRPSIGDAWIVWEEDCAAQDRVLAYNYQTGAQIALPNVSLYARYPKIRGKQVAWFESVTGGSGDIWYADLAVSHPSAHKIPARSSDKMNPVIDGNRVAWQEVLSPGVTSDVMFFNITGSALVNLTPGTDASNQIYPSIGGDRVFWQDNRKGEQDIYYNDTANWSLGSLPPSPPSGVSYQQPVSDGRSVVWYDGSSYDILMSNLSATTTIDNNGNPKFNPAICGTFIAWKEDLSGTGFGSYDIALYNTATSSKEVLTDSGAPVPADAAVADPDTDLAPVSLNGDSRVVWVDDRRGMQDIYMFTLGPATACPIVQYSAGRTDGNVPLTVTFTDTSLNSPTRRYWDFGDGSSATGTNVQHTFTTPGIYPVRLTAATLYCRNTTTGIRSLLITAGYPPVVSFTANTTEALAPLAVVFNGSGSFNPVNWSWSFGDGSTSWLMNPVHTYAAGTYNVTLNVTNAVGIGNRTETFYIHALNGMTSLASLAIPGIAVSGSPGSQNLTLNTALVPNYVLSPDTKTLTLYPPTVYGWQNITFLSPAPSGFVSAPPLITGKFSRALLCTNNSLPAMFLPATGSNLAIAGTLEEARYDPAGGLRETLWEGMSWNDTPDFGDILHKSGYSTRRIAYTLILNRSPLSLPVSGQLNLTVSSSWVTGTGDIGTERPKIFVVARGYNLSGAEVGTVLPARWIRNDSVNQIEYFVADVPPNVSYMDTFALADLSGSGNPFQLITLAIQSRTDTPPPPPPDNGPSSGTAPSAQAGGGGGGTGKGQPAPVPQDKTNPPAPEAPADPGKTATVYTNANGITSQATVLTSNDNRATITLGEGIAARDSAGNALSSISVAAAPASAVPPVSGQGISFAGAAYNLGPEGATFSPGITLSITVPQARWGVDYTIMTWDRASGTWQDLPCTFDPSTGTATATITHFSYFALFIRNASSSAAETGQGAPAPGVTAAPAPTPPPSTAVSMFVSTLFWASGIVMQNGILIAGIVLTCAVAGVWFGWRRDRDLF